MNEPHSNSNPYRFFGSLRFLLAFLVLTSHSSSFIHPYVQRLALGNIGVFMFFVLSGFVIFEALDSFYRNSIKRFLLNRFLKIFPAYWASLTFAILIMHVTSSPDLGHLSISTILKNISLVGFYFYSPTNNSPFVISIAWAVIVEVLFYVAAAGAYWVERATGTPYTAFVLVTVSGLLGYSYCSLTEGYTRFYGLFQFAPYFVTGTAIYIALRSEKHRAPIALVCLIALALMAHAYVVYNSRNLSTALTESMSILAFVFILFVICASMFCSNAAVLEVDRRLGGVTYLLFLIHLSIIHLALHLKVDGLLGLAFAVLVSITSAFVLEMLVERPLMKLRNRIRGVPLYG